MTHPDPRLGLIVSTDSSCMIGGHYWPGIPTLVWLEGIDEAASDWLRFVVVELGIAVSSAREYAKVLRPFLRFCRRRQRPWHLVDDAFLIMWREELRRASNVLPSRINISLRTIFSFYRWAEDKKYIRYRVGVYEHDELPEEMRAVAFPISAKRVFSKGRSGRVFGDWTTPLTISEPEASSSRRHTPTEQEIRVLHEIVAESSNRDRNSLILSWAEEAGPRRAEILRLCKSHMPSMSEMAAVIEQDLPWLIEIKRKGGTIKPLNAIPDLLIRTLDYIQIERRQVVEHCLKTIMGYSEPDEIFLSSATGLVLHPDSVTSLGRLIFQKAGVERANIHRLRARFAVEAIEALVDSMFGDRQIGSSTTWIETILTKAAEMMGHANPRSLRPYLTYVLNRRLANADAMGARKLKARLRQLELHEGALVRRLGHHRELHAIAVHMQAGRSVDAAGALRGLAQQLTTTT